MAIQPRHEAISDPSPRPAPRRIRRLGSVPLRWHRGETLLRGGPKLFEIRRSLALGRLLRRCEPQADCFERGWATVSAAVSGRLLHTAMVKITLSEDNDQIIAATYRRYLPTEAELAAELERAFGPYRASTFMSSSRSGRSAARTRATGRPGARAHGRSRHPMRHAFSRSKRSLSFRSDDGSNLPCRLVVDGVRDSRHRCQASPPGSGPRRAASVVRRGTCSRCPRAHPTRCRVQSGGSSPRAPYQMATISTSLRSAK